MRLYLSVFSQICWLDENKREVFIGQQQKGNTLEPQLLSFNDEASLRKVLNITNNADILKWMTREKTECAIRIAGSTLKITSPDYMTAAAKFIHG